MKKKMKVLTLLIFSQVMAPISLYADNTIPKKDQSSSTLNATPTNNTSSAIIDHFAQQTAAISQLNNTVRIQNLAIENLQQKLDTIQSSSVDNNESMSFEIWSGILLAVAALVLGAVGIGLAVFSFIGYKELINKGVEKAASIATDISKNVSEQTISKEVEEEVSNQIDRLIIDGAFDHIITERVEKYIYRGIGNLTNETDLEAKSENMHSEDDNNP